MELWVRSQDKKKLLQTKEICIQKDDDNMFYIWSNGYFLGEYGTEERALEVLDEIQIEISRYLGTKSEIVYEMPEE